MSRAHFSTTDSVRYVWRELKLPENAANAVNFTGSGVGVESSFKIGHLAQASIALSALTAALFYSHRKHVRMPEVVVDLQHAVTEFKSERMVTVDRERIKAVGQTIGGLHQCADGYVRIHDGFPNHRDATRKLLGCNPGDDRAAVAERILTWNALDLETIGSDSGLALAALRSYEQWDITSQAGAVADFPILIRKICDAPPPSQDGVTRSTEGSKCLSGIRVLDMTRVIAAPVAGRTLAAHGADVLWVTSPSLPDQPHLDIDTGRGKRTARLNIDNAEDKRTLETLLEDAHVFLQSYRPGSLSRRGFSPEQVAQRSNAGIICANLSAYGPDGPWSHRRGFDSLVQTCSGMNVSEAEHHGVGEAARPTPVQALDHASGYFMAAGISAALYRQAIEGGSYEVNVSLAGTMKYLRSLGQLDGNIGPDHSGRNLVGDVPADMFEERDSAFGKIRALKHSAHIKGVGVGWAIMPKPLGSDDARWVA